MRHRWYVLLSLLLLGAALIATERFRITAPVSAQSILSMVADSQRELSRLPATFAPISDSEEIRVGNALAEQEITSRGALHADDVIIETYLQKIGGRMALLARRKLPYRFHYIPDRDLINAFALPGGHVFIGAGLVERLPTDDQLAAVLGHEIEHVDHRHCAERLQVEAALRKVPMSQLLGIPVALFQAGYSKQQELEADREGVLLAALRGYSARGAISGFEMLERLSQLVSQTAGSPQEELSKIAVDVVSGYFRSHPLTSERIAQIRAMMVRQPALDRPEQPSKIEYIFLAWQSLDEIRQERFAKAGALASRSLERKPGYLLALQALSEAKFGSDDRAGGQQTYHLLLALDPTSATPVATWAEAFIDHLLATKNDARAETLAQSFLDLHPYHATFLRLLALAQVGSHKVELASVTAQALHRLYPDQAAEFGARTWERATGLFTDHQFAEAAAMARLSLASRAGDLNTLHLLGDAEFAQARFAESAAAYEQMLSDQTSEAALLRNFTDALASARPATAAQELALVMERQHLVKLSESNLQIEQAGLSLRSGSDDRAQAVQRVIAQGSIAPELLARLGWWYFRAGRIAEARTVLQKASRLRPEDAEIQRNLTWVNLEEGKDAGPSEEPSAPAGDPLLATSRAAVNAINEWQQKRTDQALSHWQAVRNQQPQWRLVAWRDAIYPPHITQSIAAMETELQRREAARLTRRFSLRIKPSRREVIDRRRATPSVQ